MSKPKSSITRKILRLVLMTLGLGVLGIIGGGIGALIGGKILGSDSFGFGALGLAIGGIIIGYPAGIIIGIIAIRKLFHHKGSLLLGIVGSIFGALIILLLAEPLNLNSNTDLLFVLFLISVPVFCLAGFLLKK